jgi:hypothetical protein
MRRTTLAHRVLGFIFNFAVLAMSINVVGGNVQAARCRSVSEGLRRVLSTRKGAGGTAPAQQQWSSPSPGWRVVNPRPLSLTA